MVLFWWCCISFGSSRWWYISLVVHLAVSRWWCILLVELNSRNFLNAFESSVSFCPNSTAPVSFQLFCYYSRLIRLHLSKSVCWSVGLTRSECWDLRLVSVSEFQKVNFSKWIAAFQMLFRRWKTNLADSCRYSKRFLNILSRIEASKAFDDSLLDGCQSGERRRDFSYNSNQSVFKQNALDFGFRSKRFRICLWNLKF